jgi:predicted amidophosphoribosyltransferase
MSWPSQKRLCERCRRFARVRTERFCPTCRGAVLREMRRSGYLQPRLRSPLSHAPRGSPTELAFEQVRALFEAALASERP